MKVLIQKLVEIAAPPGYETKIRELIHNEVESLADEVYVDKLGNLIARKGMPDGMKVLVAAHMDEIGLMASHVDDKGFVRFQPLGAVRPQTCLGGRVSFLNGTAGVIGAERLQDLSRIPAFEQLYIDVGATSRADCPVGVGDTAVFERPFQELGGRLTAKALDDRIGVAILIETLRRLANRETPLPHQVFFVFSVQEEVGLRGAPAAAYGLDPDLGLAVDLTSSGDTPKGIRMEVRLGKGPAVKVRDQGMLSDPRVVDWMVKTAEQAEIPFQLEILERGSTDAQPIQLTRRGVPTGCLSIPCRYVHSPSEIVDYKDVQQGVSLLVELLSHPINLGSL